MWTCHTCYLGPFLKKLGLKSIEQKKVLNEGVMACSINMESTFLVALARRASKISEDLAECVKADIFFHFFSPQFPHWKSWSKFSMSIFGTTNPCGPNFLRTNFGVFASTKIPGEISRIHLEYPQGLVRHSCKLCGFHLCESSLWQQGKPTIFFEFLGGFGQPNVAQFILG